MNWSDAQWLKEVAAIAMAALLLWRFERMTKQQQLAAEKAAAQQAKEAAETRKDFLNAIEEQRKANQLFESNHMSDNRRAIEKATDTLAGLCQQVASMKAVVDECPGRRP
jgi:hypothetical protein